MKSALLKSAIWALAGVARHVVMNRPPRNLKQQDALPTHDTILITLRTMIPLSRLVSIVATVVEILTVQSSSFRRFTSYPSTCDAATIDARSIISFIIIGMSFLLRESSFRTLGSMFSFEGIVKQDHKLITSGPYSFVRHPTYTALFGILVGYTGLHLTTCDSRTVRVVALMWFFYDYILMWKLGVRSKVEDDMLHGKFGEEWVRYSKRVPYRFIPWIL